MLLFLKLVIFWGRNIADLISLIFQLMHQADTAVFLPSAESALKLISQIIVWEDASRPRTCRFCNGLLSWVTKVSKIYRKFSHFLLLASQQSNQIVIFIFHVARIFDCSKGKKIEKSILNIYSFMLYIFYCFILYKVC